MTELIGIRECARRLNVSDTAVHKAIKNQRITIAGYTEKSNRPLVSWPQAGEDWAKNSDPLKRTHLGGSGKSPKRAAYSTPAPDIKLETRNEVLTVVASANSGDPMDSVEITEDSTLARSRQISEAYKAKLTRLDFEEKSGKLVPIEKVKDDYFKLARTVRDAILNIPDRIAPELAHETDTARIHMKLTQELHDALLSLSSDIGSAV